MPSTSSLTGFFFDIVVCVVFVLVAAAVLLDKIETRRNSKALRP